MDRGLLFCSFSVVLTSEAFASLFTKNVFDNRQKIRSRAIPCPCFRLFALRFLHLLLITSFKEFPLYRTHPVNKQEPFKMI